MNFQLLLFFWTSRFELAEAKYAVFRGVTKIFPEKLALAKLEKQGFPDNFRTRQGTQTSKNPRESPNRIVILTALA